MISRILKILEKIFLIPEEKLKYIEVYRDKTDFYKKEFNKFYLNKIFVALIYEENLQKDLKSFKYRYNESLKTDFIVFYNRILQEKLFWLNKENSIIIWVPEFFLNRLFRQYNQTYILAEELSKQSWIPFIKLVKKPKYTKHQAWLNKEKRLNNLKNCFKINPKYKNLIKWKNIILLDDVISTWTTANEISKVLKQNWVKNIYWVFLATGS